MIAYDIWSLYRVIATIVGVSIMLYVVWTFKNENK